MTVEGVMDRDEIRKACEIGGFALESVAAQWVPALLADNDELRRAVQVTLAGELAWLAGYLERDRHALRHVTAARERLTALLGEV